MEGKSDIADHLVIATGTSSRHVSSLAQRIVDNLKDYGLKSINAEGLEKGDWVLIDGGDFIVHLFSEEVREFFFDTDPSLILRLFIPIVFPNFIILFL
jgi:ribosome-associated protein